MAAPIGKKDFDKLTGDLGKIFGDFNVAIDEEKFRAAMGTYYGSGFGTAPNEEEAAALAAARLNQEALPTTKFHQPIILEKVVDGKVMRLVSCGNNHDPRDEDFEMSVRMMGDRDVDLTCPDPVQRTRRWLDTMIQADPLPNEHYTVEQLKEIKLVGLYKWEEVPEEEFVQPTVVVVQ